MLTKSFMATTSVAVLLIAPLAHADKPLPVTVFNAPSQPVPVSGTLNIGNSVLPVEVKNADPIPVSVANGEGSREIFNISVDLTTGGGSGTCTNEFVIPVPAGKRVVIENVSGEALLKQPSRLVAVRLFDSQRDVIFVPAAAAVAVSSLTGEFFFGVAGQQTHLYSDVPLRACASASAGTSDDIIVIISGYYVDKT